METEIKNFIDSNFDINTSAFNNVSFETADDIERAVLTIPLIHEGPNKKGLFWTKKLLAEIAPMFRGLPFRYDLQGSEGSSHTTKKLSSPHFDVGWTYSDERGAWYKDGVLWVKGEVTHPEVVSKLKRVTSDNKREVNYASMGVFLASSKCSICGKEHGEDDCSHVRNEKYDNEICYSIPVEVKKALHAALTNDPADGEAEITSCIFQDLASDPSFRLTANKFEHGYAKTQAMQDSINDKTVNDMNEANQNSMPNGMAPGAPQTAQPGASPSVEEILKELAERVKTVEQHIDSQNVPPAGIPPAEPTPEVINQNQNAGVTQDNMGVTSQFEKNQQGENNMAMDKTDGQYDNKATDVNPSDKNIKAEMQDESMAEPNKLDQILGLLQQLVGQMPQTADMGKESLDASKSMASKAQENLPTEHEGEGAVPESTSEGNAKNKQNMMSPDKVATADNLDETVIDTEKAALKQELADMKSELAEIKGRFEFQDQSVPEFGAGNTGSSKSVEVADMTAHQRAEKFGSSEGAFDAIFNGSKSAEKFLN